MNPTVTTIGIKQDRLGFYDDVESDREEPLDSTPKKDLKIPFRTGSIFFNQAAHIALDVASATPDAVLELFGQVAGIEVAKKVVEDPATSPEAQKEAENVQRQKEAFAAQKAERQQVRAAQIEQRQKDAERLIEADLAQAEALAASDTLEEGHGYIAKIGSSIRATMTQFLKTGLSTIMFASKKIEWTKQSQSKKAKDPVGIFSTRLNDLSLNKIAEGGSQLSTTGGNAG